MCQCLENVYSSVNQYVSNEQCLVLEKDTFKVQNRRMEFNVREYKSFNDMVSDFTL